MYANCLFTARLCWEECVTCAPTATFIKKNASEGIYIVPGSWNVS